jgi:peptidoglycan/LPS O-acetylase OafA/YrhL
MDGLRGIAMVFVFVGHFGTMQSELVHPTGAAGFYLKLIDADATFGSSFFMLLSAFFAYGSRRSGTISFQDFLRRRMFRLYPLYLIMTAIYIAGSLILPRMSKLPAKLGAAALLILESIFVLPGLLPIKPIMDVAWTLSFVLYFYFIEAGVAALLSRLRSSRLTRTAILVAVAILWAAAGEGFAWWEGRTAAFWVGMALWEVVEAMMHRRKNWAIRLSGPAAALVVIGVLARTILMLRRPDTGVIRLMLWETMITSITLSALVWVAYFGPEWWKRALSSRFLCQLGAISYSFYLVHGVAVKAFRYGVIPWLGANAAKPVVFWMSQFTGLALAIFVARAFHVLVEQPLSKQTAAMFNRLKPDQLSAAG